MFPKFQNGFIIWSRKQLFNIRQEKKKLVNHYFLHIIHNLYLHSIVLGQNWPEPEFPNKSILNF